MNNAIYPCVWCNNNAAELAEFYVSVFPDTKIIDENPVVVRLEMSGQRLMLLNGSDLFRPNPSISLMYLTSLESEVEQIYAKLIETGTALMPLDQYPFSPMYGWVEDQFGVSWQLYTGKEDIIQKIVPTLMFVNHNNGKAAEAVDFYTSLFPDAESRGLLRYSGEEGETTGNIQHGEFLINHYLLRIMDSSWPHAFNFTEGVSLVVECDSQQEIDSYWSGLISGGGEESMCGWLKDRYGVRWQIVTSTIDKLIARSPRVMEEMMKMRKLDIRRLQQAAEQD
jgi:predicted 3-demethylubiquinone-9 3-methyltransferase (glyoxalase superfamily)